MRTHILAIAGVIMIFLYASSSAQNDSIPTLEDEEIMEHGPPCGIPCHYIYDGSGNFLYCLSPCCNCQELFGHDGLVKHLADPEFGLDSLNKMKNISFTPIPSGETKEEVLDYFKQQERFGYLKILRANKKVIKYKTLIGENKGISKFVFKKEGIGGER